MTINLRVWSQCLWRNCGSFERAVHVISKVFWRRGDGNFWKMFYESIRLQFGSCVKWRKSEKRCYRTAFKSALEMQFESKVILGGNSLKWQLCGSPFSYVVVVVGGIFPKLQLPWVAIVRWQFSRYRFELTQIERRNFPITGILLKCTVWDDSSYCTG